ncbi:MAG TPA: hypothetical protein VFO54_04940, partial [Chryseosolibacter sp.]|nr:hypothetical protein [Chryseosolibacter sp.]
MRSLIIAIILCWNPGIASAQDYTFKVLASKGENEIRAGVKWLPIKVGASLKPGDELRISPNGYLALVHKLGQPLEVKETGLHKVNDLAARIREGSSVLSKYTDFILSSSTVKGNKLTATGAVHRGVNEIKVFLPPKQAIVFNDRVSVTWAKDPKTQVYIIRLNSMFGDELDRFEVQDTTVVLDLSVPKLVNEDNILVEVASKSNKDKVSEAIMLKKLSAADKTRIRNSLSNIASVTAEQTALNNLYLASFFEENKLLIDAATAYQAAIKLAPDVPYFQQAFNEFLTRNGLNI